MEALGQEKLRLDAKETAVRVEAITNLVLADFPDATVVDLWDSFDDGTSMEIIAGDGTVLWNTDEGDHEAERWASTLDTSLFLHPADETHSKQWSGIILQK